MVALGLHWGTWDLSSSLLHTGSFSCSMWDLVPWPGIKPRFPASGAWSLSHWTTREIPGPTFIRHELRVWLYLLPSWKCMERLHNTGVSFTSTQCDDENFLGEDLWKPSFCPRCPAWCLAQSMTLVMFIDVTDFHGCLVEAGSLFLATYFLFPAGVKSFL